MQYWDKEHELVLLTPEEFAELPDGTELSSITGMKYVKGVDKIDQDTRFGHLAFGFEMKKEK